MTLTLCTALSLSSCAAAYAEEKTADKIESKNTEIVYVFQDAKGEVSKVLDSEWVNHPDGEDTFSQQDWTEKKLSRKIWQERAVMFPSTMIMRISRKQK